MSGSRRAEPAYELAASIEALEDLARRLLEELIYVREHDSQVSDKLIEEAKEVLE